MRLLSNLKNNLGLVMEIFAKTLLNNGGTIVPVIIDSSLTNGTGLFNPSIYAHDDKLYLNVRHCQYTLYHSESNKHEHPWGPLVYLNPENDVTLTTTNYFGELNDDFSFRYYEKVNTSEFDVKPLWEFVGLEDARVVRWDNKFYLSGVRRDTTENGQGRMELSEISIDNKIKEISRWRIPAPAPDISYCEKNWMPILDIPYHYLKWCNPVEVVKVNPIMKTCETVFLGDRLNFTKDQRGGGQVIPFEDGYLTLTHETDLYNSEAGRKDGTYRHKFSYWSKDWKLLKSSQAFTFMGAKIEFACGLAEHRDNILVSFGYQDNASYIVRCHKNLVKEYLNA